MAAIVAYVKAKGLAGIFTFDSGMDTLDQGGAWSYEYTNFLADQLGRGARTALNFETSAGRKGRS